MKSKLIIKILTDILMSILLLLMMGYSLIGERAHEWIGVSLFGLFAAHMIWNYRYIKNMFNGKYTLLKIIQIVQNILVFISMLGSAVSGIILSRYVFAFADINGNLMTARQIHMVCTYSGFILISLHIGFHWKMILGFLTKKSYDKKAIWILRAAAAAVSIYGIYVCVKRQIFDYILLKSHFVFFDFDESIFFFLLEYLSIMILFIFLGHYLYKILNCITKRKAQNKYERSNAGNGCRANIHGNSKKNWLWT